jgi:hypothetical protein
LRFWLWQLFLGLTVLLVLQRIYLNPRDFEAGALEIKGKGGRGCFGFLEMI